MAKKLYIIGGCNGAGKTTASFTILPEILSCREFVNADEIARGLSPFQPEKVAIEAGRIMLKRIAELIEEGETFALETTLATKSYAHTIKQAQSKGYNVTMIFFWLKNSSLAHERVQKRVSEGGHDIPPEVIERRYANGLKNLFSIYLELANQVLIFDNSIGTQFLIAEKIKNEQINIIDKEKYKQLKRTADELTQNA